MRREGQGAKRGERSRGKVEEQSGGGERKGKGERGGEVPQWGGAKGKQSHTHFIIAKSVVRKMGVEMHSSWI